MPSLEYYEGRDLESNILLHQKLIEIFEFDNISIDGSTKTKGDTFGLKDGTKTAISIKNASGSNTQVHLTTLKSFSNELKIPDSIKNMLDQWLGTNNDQLFKKWSEGITLSTYELDHNRLKSLRFSEWSKVVTWFNEKNKELVLPKYLIQGTSEAKYLVWVNKKKHTLQVIDVNKLVEWIGGHCTWISMPSGTVLRCITPNKKPILWLQMKGNRENNGGYNHAPQFHIVDNWPKEFIIYENSNIQFQ